MLVTSAGVLVNLVGVHGTRLGGGSAGACAADGMPAVPTWCGARDRDGWLLRSLAGLAGSGVHREPGKAGFE
jgi:hypothetical protein